MPKSPASGHRGLDEWIERGKLPIGYSRTTKHHHECDTISYWSALKTQPGYGCVIYFWQKRDDAREGIVYKNLAEWLDNEIEFTFVHVGDRKMEELEDELELDYSEMERWSRLRPPVGFKLKKPLSLPSHSSLFNQQYDITPETELDSD